MEKITANQKRYKAIVDAYYTDSPSAWKAAKAAFLAEIGQEEMDRLADDYEQKWEHDSEVQDYEANRWQYE